MQLCAVIFHSVFYSHTITHLIWGLCALNFMPSTDNSIISHNWHSSTNERNGSTGTTQTFGLTLQRFTEKHPLLAPSLQAESKQTTCFNALLYWKKHLQLEKILHTPGALPPEPPLGGVATQTPQARAAPLHPHQRAAGLMLKKCATRTSSNRPICSCQLRQQRGWYQLRQQS